MNTFFHRTPVAASGIIKSVQKNWTDVLTLLERINLKEFSLLKDII